MREQPNEYIYPPHILPVVEKPGREWSREEYASIVAWLFDDLQLRKLLTLCLFSLGHMATAQDAEDALMEFCEKRLEKVSRIFDPDRGAGYWGYLRFCIKRDCGHLQKPIQKITNRELPLEEIYRTVDGELEFDRASTPDPAPSYQWEFNHLLKESLLKLSPPYREAFVLVKLEDRNYEEASAILGISPGLARIRVHRAIGKLRNNQKLKLYLGMPKQMEEEE